MKYFAFAALIGNGLLASLPASDFPYQYDGSQLPEQSQPQWARAGVSAPAAATISDGKLAAEVEGSKFLFWRIGTDHDKPLGDAGTWTLDKTGRATVEFKVHGSSDDPDAAIFMIILGNGSNSTVYQFYNDHIQVMGRSIPCTFESEDTYRIVVEGEKSWISSEKHGDLSPGAGLPMGGEKGRNILYFGSGQAKPAADEPVNGHRRWELDFLRWTNESAATR